MIRIAPADLADPDIVALIDTHQRQCVDATPVGSAHVLPVSALNHPDIAVYAAYDGEALVGVGALKQLDAAQGEIKSMHTRAGRRGGGVGAAMLAHLVATARERGLKRLSLETGGFDFFHPARRLYRRHGFRDTAPFTGYRPDPHSAFLTLRLADDAPPALEIRTAVETDLPAILSIYNRIVATSTAIYRDDPATLADRAAWFTARRKAGFPVLVAERGGDVLGFASYGDWRGAFPGYRQTVEHSVHVAEGARGAGVGAALMGHLLDNAREAKMHVMVGAVDADNAASLAFHDRLGFARVAHFHEVGQKFGRWLDLVFVEKRLDASGGPG